MSRSFGSVFTLARGLLLNGNIRTLAFTSMITGVYVSMLNTILQPFVVDTLGFSVPVLGLLVAIGARPLGLASSLVQPFGGYLADVLGRRLLIILGSVVGICSMASFLLAASNHSLSLLSVGFLLFGLSLLGYPAAQATIAESVAMDPGKVSVAFSIVFFFTALPGAFIPFATGYLASTVGYLVIFGAAAILESANLVVLLALLVETKQPSLEANHLSGTSRFSIGAALRLSPGLGRLILPFAMDSFSFGLSGSIIYGIWAKNFGLSATDIGLIVGTLSVSIVVSQYAAARLLLKTGPRKSLALSELLTVLVLVGWLVAPTLPVLIILAVVFGVAIATWVPALSSLIMKVAPVEERGTVGGKLAFYRGIIGVPAPFIGGLLFSYFGYSLPVTLSLLGEALTTVAILRLIPKTA